MSSAARIAWDTDEGVSRAKWLAFCEANDIAYSPNTVGRNVFYAGDVECTFGEPEYDKLPKLPNGRLDFDAAEPPEYAERVGFSTYHFGSSMATVARLAQEFWLEHGGKLSADPEIRLLMMAPEESHV